MRHFNPYSGYTLIELILVISLVSLMFFISIPRLSGFLFLDHTKQHARWIMMQVKSLKEMAVRDRRRYALHVGLEENSLWITHEAMSDEEMEKAMQNRYTLSEGVRVSDVEFPGMAKITQGVADIHFYQQGYSDMAVIHMENNQDEVLSFLIEPFLSSVKLYETTKGFED